jgi:putrescine transport system substrate-binding protein
MRKLRSRAGGLPLLAIAAALALLACCGAALAAGKLKILIWSNYFAGPSAVADFAKSEDLSISYAILDSDDTLQAKLLSGHSGYDVVYPSSNYVAKQIEAKVYEELDWSRIPNRVNLDPVLMRKVEAQDPGHRYGVPYLWGTDGIVVNATLAREALGSQAPLDSWGLLFDPAVVSKLHSCGVSLVDQASDVFPMVLAYLGKDPNSRNPADYQEAYQHLRKIRPYVDQFSSTYLNDVAGGDICVAMGWNGDAGMIRRRVVQARLNYEIVYITPKGKTGLWFTLMGIPKDAANKENAYKWINHMLDVKTAAMITNEVTYPTAVTASRALVRAELVSDPAIFPSQAELEGFFFFEPIDQEILRLMTRLWLDFKAGH